MAIKTYNEQLEEVQTAITQILTGGQSYSIGGRSLTRADLPTLFEEKKRLIPMADRETNNDGKIEVFHGVLG